MWASVSLPPSSPKGKSLDLTNSIVTTELQICDFKRFDDSANLVKRFIFGDRNPINLLRLKVYFISAIGQTIAAGNTKGLPPLLQLKEESKFSRGRSEYLSKSIKNKSHDRTEAKIKVFNSFATTVPSGKRSAQFKSSFKLSSNRLYVKLSENARRMQMLAFKILKATIKLTCNASICVVVTYGSCEAVAIPLLPFSTSSSIRPSMEPPNLCIT
uniref:Uncharacterized protein n=1 Tax=Glossina pallidipes TaxID=7398 RepID=A0A1B0AFR4_GLOPL